MTTVLDADEDGEPVDQKEYQSMIGPSCTWRQQGRTSSFLCVYALISGVTEDFTSAGRKTDL
jgi:hypothetical protein